MEITFEKMESSRLQTKGVGTKITIEGTVTLNDKGKVTNTNGSFYRVSDNANIGNFNVDYGNRSFNNMTDETLICECVTSLSQFILAAEQKAIETPLSIKL